MPGQGRLGDKSNIQSDAHGCPGCPHPAIGPAIQGSPSVNVNNRPALRVTDTGIHAACCGPNMWTAQAGSATVFINGKAAHRVGDADQHCGGMGKLIEGSGNVIVGGSSSSGGGNSGGGGDGDGDGSGGDGGGEGGNGADGGGGGDSAPGRAGGSRGGSSRETGAEAGSAPQGNAPPSSQGFAFMGSPSAPAAEMRDSGATDSSPQSEQDRYVLKLQLRAHSHDGEYVHLRDETVEVINRSRSGKVAARIVTDDDACVVIEVPPEDQNEEYDVVLQSEYHDRGDDPAPADHDEYYLRFRIVKRDGAPIPNATIQIKGATASWEVKAGVDGQVDMHAEHGASEITVGDEKFRAHTVTSDDLAGLEYYDQPYTFISETDGELLESKPEDERIGAPEDEGVASEHRI